MTYFRPAAMLLLACMLSGCVEVSPNTSPVSNAQPTSAPARTNLVGPTNAPATAPPAATHVPPVTTTHVAPPTALPAATPEAPTVAPEPTSAPAAVTPKAPTVAPGTTSAPAAAQIGSELLFLRQNALVALDVQSRKERQLTDNVFSFAPTADGARIALVRGTGRAAEVWAVQRDGSGLTQITRNDRAEASLSWSPDGFSLMFASAATGEPLKHEWQSWAAWCATSEVHVFNTVANAEQSLGAGCGPAFSPDGLRIAYTAPPTRPDAGLESSAPMAGNAVRLMNRQGKNGWNFAAADGADAAAPRNGRVVYAPAWSPDSKQLAYHRFIGYQALVDLDTSEIGGSYQGKGQLFHSGAGWLLAPNFAPNGGSVAVSENNYSDARGSSGYDTWSVTLIRLDGTREIALPNGTLNAKGQVLDTLPRGQAAAWSPDGTQLAVQLPPKWSADLPADAEVGADGQPGELWLWKPSAPPSERLAVAVDYGSPLAWLPPAPSVATGATGFQLAHPADWTLAPPSENEERTAVAPDGLRLISAAPSVVSDLTGATASQMFGTFVRQGSTDAAAVTWPDGSVYRTFTGTDGRGRAVAGATRVATGPSGTTMTLYLSTPERWPLEQAYAQALLARSGPTR